MRPPSLRRAKPAPVAVDGYSSFSALHGTAMRSAAERRSLSRNPINAQLGVALGD
jgi:hypothetical protein